MAMSWLWQRLPASKVFHWKHQWVHLLVFGPPHEFAEELGQRALGGAVGQREQRAHRAQRGGAPAGGG